MPRLFTAIEIPNDVAERLSVLRGGLPGARWVDPDNYHVTLRFLGDVDDRTAQEASDFLDDILRGPLTVSIGELDAFGGDRPRSIIAKVQPTAELSDLQTENERAVRRAGLPPEGRKFTPHVTLARLRDVKPRDVADWLAVRGGAPKLDFEVKRFVMMSSRASFGGGPYVVEEVYPLGDDTEEDDYAEARW